MEKTMRGKSRDYVSVENGDCLSKMPTATAEQLNIAKILSKPGEEVDLRKYVVQLQELTACTEDQAVTALYDCENNLERAVELLLDKLRFGSDEEWYTTGKKSRTKHSLHSDSEPPEGDAPRLDTTQTSDSKSTSSSKVDSQQKDDSGFASTELTRSETVETVSRRKDAKRRTSFVDKRTDVSDYKSSRPPLSDVQDSKPRPRLPGSDAWDPYTEYGEWGGEAIEVVNSNASISRGLQEEVVLPDELLVDTETQEIKVSSDQPVGAETPSISGDVSPKSISFTEPDSIFITKALSKLPPPAFTNLPDAAVFIVPDLLPHSFPRWPLKFHGEPCTSFRSTITTTQSTATLSPKENVSRNSHVSNTVEKNRSELDSQDFSPFVQSPPAAKVESNNFDVGKPTATRNLLNNPTASDAKTDLASATYSANHFQNTDVGSKVSTNYPAPQKPQPVSAYGSDGTNSQSNFLESTLKNYILDNLPSEISKLSATDPSHSTKISQYNLQTTVPQTQTSVSPSFSHAQGGNANSASHPANKSQVSHVANHGPIHTVQQPVVSSASQSHQQTTPVPPGMPHFIGQFAPPAYMFNLPGSSGNAPTIFDLDQFQLLQQQQRMLYDMHLQQQAATTAQSILTSTADASTSSKSTSHSLPGAMGHVSAANAAIRPDMLAPAMGHAPQMMPTGHPYFSYPGIVLMNGYSNAFLNQQQQQQQQQQHQPSGQDGSSNQGGTGHGNSPITQHQQQTSNSAQSFGGLKSVNTNVPGYEDLFEMKYNDHGKQVGFKNTGNPNYGSFQGQIPSTEVVGSKLPSTAHSNSGVLTQGFNANSGTGQPFSPQFYPSAPYLTAAAVAVAAAAAASAQQQQQASHAGSAVGGSANQSSAGVNSVNNPGVAAGASGSGPNPLHQPNGGAQAMVLGSSGSALHAHHQRSVIPQQY